MGGGGGGGFWGGDKEQETNTEIVNTTDTETVQFMVLELND